MEADHRLAFDAFARSGESAALVRVPILRWRLRQSWYLPRCDAFFYALRVTIRE